MRILSLFAMLAIFMLLVASKPAEGQNCVTRNRTVFCPTVVNHRVVTTNAYVAPVVNYHHAAAVVAIEVPTNLDYYYSLNSFYQSQLIADAVVGKLTLLNQQQANRSVLPSTTYKDLKLGGGIQSMGQGLEYKQYGAPPGSDEPDAKLAAIVGNSCIRCHSAAKAGGGLDLSNLRAIPELQRYKIADWVNTGRMPKGGQPLPDEQAKLFSDWANNFKVATGN